ncbi:MAG: D-tyrosyl-tRNA(Tyr) deacylase [Bacteroidales bacterium]|nr:D-tyrosyl-tRNA(Tyr) deacylase [Bacteroidales bacterium]
MRVLVQLVSRASVEVGGGTVSEIGPGLLVLVGIKADDTQADIDYLVRKIVNLRVFPDGDGVMNLSVLDVGGEILAVSQFTLMASCRRGNRPSYIAAAPAEISEPLYGRFCESLSLALGREVGRGVFGAHMKVGLVNDGPVTIWIDSADR